MEGRKARGIQAAILTMSLVQMSTNGIAPILSDLGRAFPEASTSAVQFLMTFPSLLVIVFSLVSGAAARWVPKKGLAAAGCALVAASGVGAFCVHPSLAVLFFWAGLLGSGVGLVVPIAASLVTDCFVEPQRSVMMGLQSGAANAGGMLMALLGGFLAVLGWRWNYLVYLIAIPGLLLSLCALPRHTGAAAQAGGRLSLSRMVLPCLSAVAVTMLFNLVPTNLSLYMAEHAIGSAVQAGTGTTLLLLSGTLSAAVFGPIHHRLGGGTVALGFGMLTAGLLICANADSLPLLYLGSVVSGTSISMVMPHMMLQATTAHPQAAALASALVMGCSNLGAFLTPLLTGGAAALFGRPDAHLRFLLGAAAALAAALIALAGRLCAARRGRAERIA